jgi:hypothetical protein
MIYCCYDSRGVIGLLEDLLSAFDTPRRIIAAHLAKDVHDRHVFVYVVAALMSAVIPFPVIARTVTRKCCGKAARLFPQMSSSSNKQCDSRMKCCPASHNSSGWPLRLMPRRRLCESRTVIWRQACSTIRVSSYPCDEVHHSPRDTESAVSMRFNQLATDQTYVRSTDSHSQRVFDVSTLSNHHES